MPQWTAIDKKDTHSVRSVPTKSKRQVMLIPAQSQMAVGFFLNCSHKFSVFIMCPHFSSIYHPTEQEDHLHPCTIPVWDVWHFHRTTTTRRCSLHQYNRQHQLSTRMALLDSHPVSEDPPATNQEQSHLAERTLKKDKDNEDNLMRISLSLTLDWTGPLQTNF